MTKRGTGKDDGQLTLIGDLITPKMIRQYKSARTGPTPIQRRLIDAAANNIESAEDRSYLYQHSVFCQAYLPYRNPGDQVRTWERLNGGVHLKLKAGEAMHPTKGRLVDMGLPYGPKSRLVLMAINQLAIVKQSPHIEVEDSLTAFVRRVLKLDPKGRNITEVKEQLAAVSSCQVADVVEKDGLLQVVQL